MGEVYRAKDTRLGASVAIKVLPDEVARDAQRPRPLRAEARVVAALSHPEHPRPLRRREEGCGLVRRHGASGRRDAARGAGQGTASAPEGPRRRAAGGRRPRGGAREGDRPPGRQAREHLPDEGRPRQAPRLRPGPPRRRAPRSVRHPVSDARGREREGSRPRDRGLHVAGAGAWGDRRLPERPVLARRRPLRDADRESARSSATRPPRRWPPSSGRSRSR